MLIRRDQIRETVISHADSIAACLLRLARRLLNIYWIWHLAFTISRRALAPVIILLDPFHPAA